MSEEQEINDLEKEGLLTKEEKKELLSQLKTRRRLEGRYDRPRLPQWT